MFEVAEGLDEAGGVHDGEEFGAGLAIAVLSGERAAVADDEVGGLGDEGAVFGEALGGAEVEVELAMEAALAEVAEEDDEVAEAVGEGVELAEVGAELLGVDGGVFPATPGGLLLAGDLGGAEGELADLHGGALSIGGFEEFEAGVRAIVGADPGFGGAGGRRGLRWVCRRRTRR